MGVLGYTQVRGPINHDNLTVAQPSAAEPVDKKGFAQLVGEAQRTSGAGHGLTDAEVELLFKVRV